MSLGPTTSSARDLRDTVSPVTPTTDRFGTPTITGTIREPVPFELDLAVVSQTVKSRWRALVVGMVAGAVLGGSVIAFVPPRFSGRSMILIRTSKFDPAALAKTTIGPISELMPGALGGKLDDDLSTEIALLSSRATLGVVSDSLRLQVVPKSPSRTPPYWVIDSIRTTGRFKPTTLSLVPGANRFERGTIWTKRAAKVKVYDREDAVDELEKRGDARLLSGNTVQILYRGRDSVTAAEVPNLIAAVYMVRRKTVDRGLNQRRLEFLVAKSDSVRLDLRHSADVLANVAERSGVRASPEIGGKALAEAAGGLESRIAELRATEIALGSLIDATRSRNMDPRFLAGFPDLLRSIALNDLLSQIARVETERTILLGRVPETSPQVRALARARDSLTMQMSPIATSYRASITQTRLSLQRELQVVNGRISRLPFQAAAVAKEQAEVTRLAQMNAGMGVQVLDARLAAMLEGGDVRLIDEAVSPRRVTFPRPLPTMAFCIALGILGGLVYALFGLRREVAGVRPA